MAVAASMPWTGSSAPECAAQRLRAAAPRWAGGSAAAQRSAAAGRCAAGGAKLVMRVHERVCAFAAALPLCALCWRRSQQLQIRKLLRCASRGAGSSCQPLPAAGE